MSYTKHAEDFRNQYTFKMDSPRLQDSVGHTRSPKKYIYRCTSCQHRCPVIYDQMVWKMESLMLRCKYGVWVSLVLDLVGVLSITPLFAPTR